MNVGPPAVGKTDIEGRFTLRFIDNNRDGALIGANTVRMDDERTFNNVHIKPRVPRDWTDMFTVPPEGTSEAHFELGRHKTK